MPLYLNAARYSVSSWPQRGNASLASPLSFVRFEPFVIPKKSLTGDSIERVDTRVLQAVYRLERTDLRLYPGQQMDVFIEAAVTSTASP